MKEKSLDRKVNKTRGLVERLLEDGGNPSMQRFAVLRDQQRDLAKLQKLQEQLAAEKQKKADIKSLRMLARANTPPA